MAQREHLEARTAARRELRARRAALTAEFIDAASSQITHHVVTAQACTTATQVVGFVGVRGEPDTRALLRAALNRGCSLWLPQVRGAALRFARLRDEQELVPAGFGLLEPADDPAAAPISLTELGPALVLIPGLAFTRDGGRLGFGKGYYDRALAPVRDDPGVVKVGICFAEALEPAQIPIPIANHDVPVDFVVTEQGWHVCRAK